MFKIRSIDTFPNVFQNHHFTEPVLTNYAGEKVELKGSWGEKVFKNNQDIVLELACGKGDYTLGLAKVSPEKNFIGIDIKGARIFTGAKQAIEEQLSNVAFARMRIEHINNFFAPEEIAEIWITFPDPFPKKGDAKRRLSAHPFLQRYKQILKPGGIIHFKTDDLPLFHFTKESVETFGCKLIHYHENIYLHKPELPELYIQTFYEKGHIANGRTINYLSFQF